MGTRNEATEPARVRGRQGAADDEMAAREAHGEKLCRDCGRRYHADIGFVITAYQASRCVRRDAPPPPF